jgi:uncharacterized protein (DUF1499 family)
MKYISQEERLKIANQKFGEKVNQLYEISQPPKIEQAEPLTKSVTSEEVLSHLLSVCLEVSKDDIERYIDRGVQSFQKSATILGNANFDVKRRRSNLTELIKKAASFPNPSERMNPYEIQMLMNLDRDIAEAIANNGNLIKSDFLDRVRDYFNGNKNDKGINVFVPRLTSISKSIKDDFITELYKSALLSAMEKIVWSNQGQFLDQGGERDLPFE